MSFAPTTDLLRAILAAFNAHDVDGVMGFFADDCVLEMPRGPEPWGTRYEGFSAVREGIRGRFTGIPDVTYSDDTHTITGDTGTSRWTLRGTMAATGKRIDVRGCDFYDFRDGKVVKKDSFWKIVEPAGSG